MSEKVYEAAMGLLKLSFLKKEKALGKTKKNDLQTHVLQSIFALTSHPSAATQIDLAILLNMPIRSVKIWFQNARQQKKKRMLVKGQVDYDELINDDLNNVPVSSIIEIINRLKDEECYTKKYKSDECYTEKYK
ncbi:Homeobox protein HD-11 [Nosema granulosis]|uniref:Homeobox protein HD-11 n=1 Tax=Nosema granulosis TaxID=83296 RepID=A0A9P6GZG8_9MICR|nr:Homeobox protein HD-11 [Nosema granulosis]